MEMHLNGKLVSEGTGSDCLGSPLIATLWLAKTMVVLGSPLKAGDIILSGALGPMATVISGDSVSAKIEGLGEVSFQFIK
jgi:2-keto-4-pentenoate hydratase